MADVKNSRRFRLEGLWKLNELDEGEEPLSLDELNAKLHWLRGERIATLIS